MSLILRKSTETAAENQSQTNRLRDKEVKATLESIDKNKTLQKRFRLSNLLVDGTTSSR
ncbi:MAG: hypothetical protein GXY48_14390 [Methanomicrobiales archaeon]|nr:hypothetical protein [Methanomicrobiales archaeon]